MPSGLPKQIKNEISVEQFWMQLVIMTVIGDRQDNLTPRAVCNSESSNRKKLKWGEAERATIKNIEIGNRSFRVRMLT